MAIITLEQIRAHLSLTDDLGTADDGLIENQVAAAQNHIERILGFQIEETYGGAGQQAVPPALKQAVLMLAAWWYDCRETAGMGSANEMPFGVASIVNEFREFTF